MCFAKKLVFVAAVWNIYRKTRLLLLNIIVRSAKRLGDRYACQDEKAEVEDLASDMVASILFHISGNVETFMRNVNNDSNLSIVPGKAIGGVLLMHPLFVTANLSVVSPSVQSHMRNVLAWIGAYMGIGQATLLSKVRYICNYIHIMMVLT